MSFGLTEQFVPWMTGGDHALQSHSNITSHTWTTVLSLSNSWNRVNPPHPVPFSCWPHRPAHGVPCLETSRLHRANSIEYKHFNLLRWEHVSSTYGVLPAPTLCTLQLQLPKLPAHSTLEPSPRLCLEALPLYPSSSQHVGISALTTQPPLW